MVFYCFTSKATVKVIMGWSVSFKLLTFFCDLTVQTVLCWTWSETPKDPFSCDMDHIQVLLLTCPSQTSCLHRSPHWASQMPEPYHPQPEISHMNNIILLIKLFCNGPVTGPRSAVLDLGRIYLCHS